MCYDLSNLPQTSSSIIKWHVLSGVSNCSVQQTRHNLVLHINLGTDHWPQARLRSCWKFHSFDGYFFMSKQFSPIVAFVGIHSGTFASSLSVYVIRTGHLRLTLWTHLRAQLGQSRCCVHKGCLYWRNPTDQLCISLSLVTPALPGPRQHFKSSLLDVS